MFKNLKFQLALITLIYFVFMIWFVQSGGHKNLILFSFFIVIYITGIRTIVADHKIKQIDKDEKVAIHHARIKYYRNNVLENIIILLIYGSILYFKNIGDLFDSPYFMIIIIPAGQILGQGVQYFMEKEELQITLNKLNKKQPTS